MSRMLIAVPAALLLVGGAVQGAPAKPGGSAPQKPTGPSAEVILDASATASTSGHGSIASVMATCPSKTKAAGGGFEAPYSSEVIGLVYESVRVRNRGWRASMQLLDPGEASSATLTVWVYCRPHLPRARTRSVTVPTTGETQIGPTVSASCRPGEVTLAGGFRMPPPLRDNIVTSLFFDSLRSESGAWDTRVVTGPAGASTVTGEAYCARRGSTPLAATGTSSPNGRDFTASTATATCPAGLSPASGGFAQPDSGLMSFFIVYESRRDGDTWRVSGLHSGNEPAVALNAAGYCA